MKALIIILSIISYNAYSMRCGTQIVDEGDTVVHLLEACGKPYMATANRWYYQQNGNMTCTVSQNNDLVTNIECNR